MNIRCRYGRIHTILTAVLLFFAAAACAETVEYEGLIAPFEVVDIGAPAKGIVAKVAVERSSLVEKGQVLVELDASVEKAALERAEAIVKFDGEVGLQKAHLALARRNHERLDRISVISPLEKDQAATEIVLTRHRLKKAKENLTLARLEMKQARALLDRCSIKSPISGVVVERYVSPGEYVDVHPLLQVAQVDPLRVEVIVPAGMFGKIRPGMAAQVIPELPDYGERSASVTIVDRVIDAASSTFGVRLEMSNPDWRMPSGLKCMVRFELEEDDQGLQHSLTRVLPHPKRH
jgi:RND family efflux transporter MFP subunit